MRSVQRGTIWAYSAEASLRFRLSRLAGAGRLDGQVALELLRLQLEVVIEVLWNRHLGGKVVLNLD